MIREGQPISMQSDEGLTLNGTVAEYDPDEGLTVVTNTGDEWTFCPTEFGFEDNKGNDWAVLRKNPCLPCAVALNPNEKKIGRLPTTNPEGANTMGQWDAEYGELEAYIDNDYELYRQKQAIEKNLQRKVKSGRYDPAKAPKLWMYMVDAGARKYCKEFGCSVKTTFPKKAVREPLSVSYAREWERENKTANPRGRRPNPMTKAQAWTEFKAMVLPAIKAREAEGSGGVDKPMRREEWNNYVDMLQRDGQISEAQADTWSHPAGLLAKNPVSRSAMRGAASKQKRKGAAYKGQAKRKKNPGKKATNVRSLVARALK